MVTVINSYIQNVITEIIAHTLETLPARTRKKEISGLIKMDERVSSVHG